MDKRFLQGRDFPTVETMVGAATRMSHMTNQIHQAASNIVKDFSTINEAAVVGTTRHIHSEDNVMRLDTINKCIDSLIELREVLLGKKKEPVQAAS